MWAGAGAGASVADTKCWPGRDPGLSTHGRAAGRSTRWASRIVPMVSDGRSQSLAVDRAMSLRSEPVMLDEALPGLAPKTVTEVFMMADDGITTLLVEQNMQMGLKHSDHGGVLDPGKTMCGGSAGDVAEDLRILENSGAGLPVRAPPPPHTERRNGLCPSRGTIPCAGYRNWATRCVGCHHRNLSEYFLITGIWNHEHHQQTAGIL